MSSARGSRTISASDLLIVSGQLGRTARDVSGIAVRCPFDRPAVIETLPRFAGRPNPTLLYLTCPTATLAISRAEAAGGVRRLRSAHVHEPGLAEALDEVTRAYRRRRGSLAPAGDPRPEAGIGGPAGPQTATCLHAYGAALLAALEGWLDPAPAAPSQSDPGEVASAAARACDAFLPSRDALWCVDDRCARWATGSADQGFRGERAHGAGARSAAARDERVAAIDVGTISVRLLVADLRSGRPEQVVRRAEVTRLGEGLRPGACLDEAALRRTRAAVGRYVQEARRTGAVHILLAGTSAAREAADGTAFVRTLGEQHHLAAAVLTGAEEAELAYTGASLDMQGDFVVLDVGGGSTELIRRVEEGTIEGVSLHLGASRATERWIHSDPPSAAELTAVREEAVAVLEPLQPRFAAGTGPLVGVAGTVTTLACMDAGLAVYDSETIHLRRLSLKSVNELVARLSGLTNPQRAALPCVQAGRAPVIVAGAVIVKAAMEVLGHDTMVVSERDLLDGLILRAALLG